MTKKAFLTEMVQLCNIGNKPILIGGDFNIIRGLNEKIMLDTMTGGLYFLMLPLIAWISEK